MTNLKVKEVLTYRILVKREEWKSDSGIVLPDDSRSVKALRGTVVGVGPEVVAVNVGDRIAWAKYSDTVEVDTDEGTLLVMNSEDILLTLEHEVN